MIPSNVGISKILKGNIVSGIIQENTINLTQSVRFIAGHAAVSHARQSRSAQ